MEDNEIKVPVGIKDFEEYDKNPFMVEAAMEVGLVTKNKISRWRTGDGMFVTERDNLGKVIFLGSQKKVDSEEFTKIFHRKIKSMLDLSDRAIKLIIYIASKLEKNSLQIDFDIDDCIKSCSFSRATIYRLLADLLKFRVIARYSKRNYIYFINPVVLFNGNRLNVLESYYKEEDDMLSDVIGIPRQVLPQFAMEDELIKTDNNETVNVSTGEIINTDEL